ncbi:MAG: HAD family hydrolase [Acidobacteria bacterium]|nr:HAD family hydrolase [Acidobacteriota bacterium]
MRGLNRPAAFLDRDGTLNMRPPDHQYVRALDEFTWLPGAREGAALLARAGYKLVVVSNQRGVARGLVTEAVLREIEQHIQQGLARDGCRIDAFRYCTHDLAAACSCRKPQPGLVIEVTRELDLDIARSWLIGDSETDVAAGRAAGCRTALIARRPPSTKADIRVGSLLEAAKTIAAHGTVPA